MRSGLTDGAMKRDFVRVRPRIWNCHLIRLAVQPWRTAAPGAEFSTQNRFDACPFGASHPLEALRCIEMNPTRVGLVMSPRCVEWSSAEPHLPGQDPARFADKSFWCTVGGVPAWAGLLNEQEAEIELKVPRSATRSVSRLGLRRFERNCTRNGRKISWRGYISLLMLTIMSPGVVDGEFEFIDNHFRPEMGEQ